jgi:Tol biopolymer transport system component
MKFRAIRNPSGHHALRVPALLIAVITALPVAALAAAGPASAIGTTTRISTGPNGVQANSGSASTSISAYGRYVAFLSNASNLVSGDTNNAADIFVSDTRNHTVKRVSVTSSGGQTGTSTGAAYDPYISGTGRYVVFTSDATNLVSGDTNGSADVFIRDLSTGTTKRVSVATGGAQGNLSSFEASVSADGRYVAFVSSATNLVPGDTNNQSDVFVRDLTTGVTSRVSVSTTGVQSEIHYGNNDAQISADGTVVVFTSFASNLVSGDTNGTSDIFTHNLQTGVTARVSLSSTGGQATGGNHQTGSTFPSISADGKAIAFLSLSSGLVPGTQVNVQNAYTRNLTTGVTQRVALGAGGVQGDTDGGDQPFISPDGQYVAFTSYSTNLVSGDTNGQQDVFVRNLAAQTTSRLSLTCSGAQSNGYSYDPVLSTNATHIAFSSLGSNLVPNDTNNTDDVFYR